MRRKRHRKSASFARYFRKKSTRKYPERFIQGLDYRELTPAERNNRKGHKYEMLRTRAVMTRIKGLTIKHKFFSVEPSGLMQIKKGYRSDGPSSLTVDTPSFMRACWPHDIWFQILREFFKLNITGDAMFEVHRFDPRLIRKAIFDDANLDLRLHCKQDGMLWPRYDLVYWVVKNYGAKHAGGV